MNTVFIFEFPGCSNACTDVLYTNDTSLFPVYSEVWQWLSSYWHQYSCLYFCHNHMWYLLWQILFFSPTFHSQKMMTLARSLNTETFHFAFRTLHVIQTLELYFYIKNMIRKEIMWIIQSNISDKWNVKRQYVCS